MLKAPYTWVAGSSGSSQRGLKLTWTLDFTGGGRQGRVRAKVRKLEQEGRILRSRTAPTSAANNSDDDDEEDDDEEDYDENAESVDLSDDEEEDTSEFMETPTR